MTTGNKIYAGCITAVLLASLALPAFAGQAERGRTAQQQRISPPVSLACDRNQLTSFNGEVTNYRRDAKSISITIHTDWNTFESLTIGYSSPAGSLKNLMLNGRVFTIDDWPEIETKTGVLQDGMHAIAWVCIGDEDLSVIDWRPDFKPG